MPDDIHIDAGPTTQEPKAAPAATADATSKKDNPKKTNTSQQAQEIQIDPTLKGRKMDSEAILTDARNERGGKKQFELDWKQDKDLYEELNRIQRKIQHVRSVDPNNPTLTLLSDQVESLLSKVNDRATRITDARNADKKYQDYESDKKLKKTYSDEYRIFTDEKDIVTALKALEEHELIVGAAIGKIASSEGIRSVSFTYPDEAMIQEAINAHPVLGKFLKVAGFGALGGAGGAAVSGGYNALKDFVSYYSSNPQQLLNDLQTFGINVTTAVDKVFSNPAALAGIVGSAAAITAAKFLDGRIGNRHDQPQITVKFEDTDSQLVTEYAKSILGDPDYVSKFGAIQQLRTGIYEKIGLNLGSENQRAMIGLSVSEMDPMRQGLSEGQGLDQFNNLRQAALKKIIIDKGYKDLSEVPPADQLEMVLNAYDVAMVNFLGDKVDSVLKKYKEGDLAKQSESDAQRIENMAEKKNKVDTSTIEASIETKTKEKAEAEVLAGVADTSKAQLDELERQITIADKAKKEAEQKRLTSITRHQTSLTQPPYGGKTEENYHADLVNQLQDRIDDLDKAISGPNGLEGKEKDYIQNVSEYQRDIAQFNAELSQFAGRDPVNFTDPEKQLILDRQKKINERSILIENATQFLKSVRDQLVQKRSDREREDRKLNKEKDELSRITNKLKDVDEQFTQTDNNLTSLKQQKDALLTTLGIATNADVKTIALEIAKIKAKPGEIQKEIDKLTKDRESGKPDAETQKIVEALQMATKLVRAESKGEKLGRGNEVRGEVVKGRVDFTDYERVIETFFDPENPEARDLAKGILNQSMMVEIAISQFIRDPAKFFANKPQHYDAYKSYLLSEKEAKGLQEYIDDLLSRRPDNYQNQVDILRRQIEDKKGDGYRKLLTLYKDVMSQVNSDPQTGVRFTTALIESIAVKSKQGTPFDLVTWPDRAEFKKPEEIGISRSTEFGGVRFTPSQTVDGNQLKPRELVYDTPEDYKIRYVDNGRVSHEIGVKLTAGIVYERSEAENKPDGIQVGYTIEMTDNLYEMFSSTPATNWPDFIKDVMYDAGGQIKPKESLLKDDNGKYVPLTLAQEKSNISEAINQLHADFGRFTNFENLIEGAMGKMVQEMNPKQRNEWLSKINQMAVPYTNVPGIPGIPFGIKLDANGEIIILQSGGGAVDEFNLTDIKSKLEGLYRNIYRINAGVRLTSTQQEELRNAESAIFQHLGKEAMKALQRF